MAQLPVGDPLESTQSESEDSTYTSQSGRVYKKKKKKMTVQSLHDEWDTDSEFKKMEDLLEKAKKKKIKPTLGSLDEDEINFQNEIRIRAKILSEQDKNKNKRLKRASLPVETRKPQENLLEINVGASCSGVS